MVNDEHRSDIIDVTVRLVRRSDRAALCQPARGAFDEHKEPHWFPLSLVEIADNGNGTHTLTCPEWKLRQAGFL